MEGICRRFVEIGHVSFISDPEIDSSEEDSWQKNKGPVLKSSSRLHNNRLPDSFIAVESKNPALGNKHEQFMHGNLSDKSPPSSTETSGCSQNNALCSSLTFCDIDRGKNQTAETIGFECCVDKSSAEGETDTKKVEQTDSEALFADSTLCRDSPIYNPQWWWDSENLAALGYKSHQSSNSPVYSGTKCAEDLPGDISQSGETSGASGDLVMSSLKQDYGDAQVDSSPALSAHEVSSRHPISMTPVRRPEVTFRELEPMKLADLYCRARLDGEADDQLVISLFNSDTELTDLTRDSSTPVCSNVHKNMFQSASNESGVEEKLCGQVECSPVCDCVEDMLSKTFGSHGDEDAGIDDVKAFTAIDARANCEGESPNLNIVDPTLDNGISNTDRGLVIPDGRPATVDDITNHSTCVETDADISDNTLCHVEPCSLDISGHSSSSSVDSGLSATSPEDITDRHAGRDSETLQSLTFSFEEREDKLLKNPSFEFDDTNTKPLTTPRFYARSRIDSDAGAEECFDLIEKETSVKVGELDHHGNKENQEGNDEENDNVDDDEDDDEVFSENSFCSESDRSRGSPVNFAVLFRYCRDERDAARYVRDPARDVPCEENSSFSSHSITAWDSHREVLCRERVSQMTKTYNDIEAVTRLLEEKERDLELAARIGQTLLSKNKELVARTEALEEQLSQATERTNQLRHEMGMKDELLRFYNEDLERDAGGGDTSPAFHAITSVIDTYILLSDLPLCSEKPAADVVNVDFLEKKVKSLEDENLHLRLESANLQSATSNYEDKEKKLVEDCIQQLAVMIYFFQTLHQLTLENMDVHEKLTASTESQRKLTKELGTMQDRYDELMEVLEETQAELQLMRSRQRPRLNASGQHQVWESPGPSDSSLASELEDSLRQEQLDQAFGQRRSQSWRVFETAKAAKKAAAKAAQSSSSASRMSISASGDATDRSSFCGSSQLSLCTSDVESQASDSYSGDLDSFYESNSELGRPGIPGSNDLDNALRRLATRRANEINEREFLAREREREGQISRKFSGSSEGSTWSNQTFDAPCRDGLGSGGGSGGAPVSRPHSPAGSVSSQWSSATGSVQPSGASSSGQGFKISDRLQIVKPMEGSMTLRHWQHLANPHLGGIFEQRQGIQMKGARMTPGEAYPISDLEEDDEPKDIHTRREQDRGLTYTFTDSTVQNFGLNPHMGLGALFSSSNESAPPVANFSTATIGTDRMPYGTSTPKLSSGTRLSTNSMPSSSIAEVGHGKKPMSYTMSSGLAALLLPKESPAIRRPLVRAASIPRLNLTSSESGTASMSGSENTKFISVSARSLPAAGEAAPSNPPVLTTATSTVSALDLNPSWASWASRSTGNLSSFPPLSSSSSAALPSSIWSRRLPGSGYFEHAPGSHREIDSSESKADNAVMTFSNPSSPRRAAIFTTGMTGQGLLQQLKSKGLSLYGLWSGKAETQSDETSSASAARPRLASGTSTDAGLDDRARGIATLAFAKEEDECGSEAIEPTAESIMPSDSGVVGALVNFRRSGLL
ncbi:trafficking kinesin-binding protein 1 [Elysia marginata]|uniref:Trafficking kinesin-binding protein 1 n=1 Tax=Elysia marginata TaxID=1093978 RepID=A0AAV4INB1_9GAST|nr:trafficking kinesin-binding protein 1 [Elysia marginata]